MCKITWKDASQKKQTNLKGWKDGSLGEGTSHHAGQLELNPQVTVEELHQLQQTTLWLPHTHGGILVHIQSQQVREWMNVKWLNRHKYPRDPGKLFDY